MKISLSASDVLFHITSISNAVGILLRDRFELKPVEGSEWEEKLTKGKFYLSTARSLQSSYVQKTLGSYSVVLKLDGRKLSHKHAIKAIDYWQSNDGENADDKLYRRKNSNEMEDRVLSDKQFIEPAHIYISEVHVRTNNKRQMMFALKKQALLRKIPIFFYQSDSDLLSLGRKAVDVKFGKQDIQDKESAEDKEYRRKRDVRTFRNSMLRRWLEVYQTPIKTKKVWDTAKTLNKEHGYRAYSMLQYSDAISSFRADLHNAKSVAYGTSSKEREHLDKLIAIMRGNKQTPEEFIKQLRDKWYPRQ